MASDLDLDTQALTRIGREILIGPNNDADNDDGASNDILNHGHDALHASVRHAQDGIDAEVERARGSSQADPNEHGHQITTQAEADSLSTSQTSRDANLKHAANRQGAPPTINPTVELGLRAADGRGVAPKAAMNGSARTYATPMEMVPGDTQVVPSQVWADYENSVAKSKKEADEAAARQVPSITPDHAPSTYRTDDTGYIDLALEDIYNEHEPDEEEGDKSDKRWGSEDELGEDTQTRLGAVTSPTRMSPTTPALAGHKRDLRGNIIYSAVRTPSQDLSAMFGKGAAKPKMGLSQVFNQTQARSSPPPTGFPRSDPIFDRPSPEFRVGNQSSPGPESSPVMTRRKTLPRATTDPQGVYVSMRESQRLRRKKEAEIQRQIDEMEDQDELNQDSEERKAELRRQKAAIAAETDRLFSTIDIPSTSWRPDRKWALSASADHNLKTPLTRSVAPRHTVVISDDTPKASEVVNDLSENESETESRDEYDELSQAVINIPRSSPAKPTRSSSAIPLAPSSPRRMTKTRDIQDTRVTKSFHPGSYTRSSNADNNTPSQTVQVAYSQPGNIDPRDHLPQRPPRPVMVSSVESRTFVSQSQQDLSVSSSPRARVRIPVGISSSIPRAPAATANDVEAEQDNPVSSPPSSPPIIGTSQIQNADIIDVDELDNDNDYDNVGDENEANIDSAPLRYESKLTSKKTSLARIRKPRPMRSIPDTSPASNHGAYSGQTHVDGSNSGGVTGGRSEEAQSLAKSNNTGTFDTAPSHLPLPANEAASRPPTSTSSTPRPQKPKRLRDVRLDPSQPKIDDADTDLNFNILNEDDFHFTAALNGSSPPQQSRKRAKMSGRRRALGEPAVEENRLPPSPHTRPKRRRQVVQESPPDRVERVVEQTGSTKPASFSAPAKSPVSSVRAGENMEDPDAVRESHSPAPEPMLTRKSLRSQTSIQPKAKVESRKSAPAKQSVAQVNLPTSTQQAHALPELAVDTTAPAVKRFPNRVLAHFKDVRISFWPAYCLDTPNDAGHLKVQFDDGNVDFIPTTSIFKFELRPGDLVRVNIEEHRAKTFIVCETKEPLPLSSTSITPETDVFGNRTVVVRQRQRNSIDPHQDVDNATFEVPTSKVYVVSSLIRHYADRVYTGTVLGSVRLETPINLLSAPPTPNSRSRRRTGTASLLPVPTTLKFESKDGLFSNMVFALSYSDVDEAGKKAVILLIRAHGGHILPDSFDALFDLPDSLTVPTAPPPSSAATGNSLTLTSRAANVGFVALVTDSHSRRKKYMQALALDIPCLSSRWIHDSATKDTVLPWDRYLLPAGESSTLSGAVRSRTFTNPSYDATAVTLKRTVESRPKLINGKNVIIVVGKGKASEERRRTYVFLTFALGAARVERVEDIEAVKALLTKPDAPWDWVYVDDRAVEGAGRELAGGQVGGKKRKRASETAGETGGKSLSAHVDVGRKRVRIVGDEFVIQTLILGALVEED